MTTEPESQGFHDQARATGNRVAGLHPLQQASLRIAEFREGRSAFKARDLVGLLLCHGARAWRASQPASDMRIRVCSPDGSAAVRLRLR